MSTEIALEELCQVLEESGLELSCVLTEPKRKRLLGWGRRPRFQRARLHELDEPSIRDLIRLAREAADQSRACRI